MSYMYDQRGGMLWKYAPRYSYSYSGDEYKLSGFSSPLFGGTLRERPSGYKYWETSPTEPSVYLSRTMRDLSPEERQAIRQYLYPSKGPKFFPAGRTNRDVTLKTPPERPPYMPTLTPQEAMDIRRRAIMSGMGENFARALEAQRLAEVERQFREDAARRVRSRYIRYTPENQAFINRMNEEAIKGRYPIIPSDLR